MSSLFIINIIILFVSLLYHFSTSTYTRTRTDRHASLSASQPRRRSKRCTNFMEGREIRQKGREDIVCVFEFKFRISTWRPRPRGTPGDGPGQPSDAVFGLAVLQFLNRIGRRQIPRDVDAKTFPVAHICIYVYTCIYVSGVTATPSPNCKLRITPVKVHRQVAIFKLFTGEPRVYSIYRRRSVWNNHDGVKPGISSLSDTNIFGADVSRKIIISLRLLRFINVATLNKTYYFFCNTYEIILKVINSSNIAKNKNIWETNCAKIILFTIL